MVSIRAHSIQDILRNINRRLSVYDIYALICLLFILLGLIFMIRTKETMLSAPLVYNVAEEGSYFEASDSSHIFASVSGKTYTYSWCQGASRIKEENKIFFKNEDEAKRTGRTLSKLCK